MLLWTTSMEFVTRVMELGWFCFNMFYHPMEHNINIHANSGFGSSFHHSRLRCRHETFTWVLPFVAGVSWPGFCFPSCHQEMAGRHRALDCISGTLAGLLDISFAFERHGAGADPGSIQIIHVGWLSCAGQNTVQIAGLTGPRLPQWLMRTADVSTSWRSFAALFIQGWQFGTVRGMRTVVPERFHFPHFFHAPPCAGPVQVLTAQILSPDAS